MEPTRRGWAVAGCGLALVAGSLLLAVPALLLAAAAVGGLLLGAAATFVLRFGAERDALSVTVEAEPSEPLVDDPASLTLSVERPAPDLSMRVVLPVPGAAEGDGPLVVEVDDHEHASLTTPVTWPVAGTYGVGSPRVVATDPLGLFVAAFESPATTTVRARARHPATVQLGHGGERVATAFGEHHADLPGADVEPDTLQRYEPGADVGRIDWKATARLDELYVVDPERTTTRETVLLLDHRATMATGEGSETPLSYLRHAALAVLGSARELGDPIGAYAVGDHGVTVAESPGVGPGQYAAIEDAVRSLVATPPPAASTDPARSGDATGAPGADAAGAHAADSAARATDADASASGAVAPADEHGVDAETAAAPGEAPATGAASVGRQDASSTGSSATGPSSPGVAQGLSAASPSRVHGAGPLGTAAAARLRDDRDEFSSALRPLLGDETSYVHRVASDPLFAAARTFLRRRRGSLWTVIVTDDSRREELREAVKVARGANDRVLVLLAPRVLFESDGLAAVDDAYERYRSFESFRQDLDGMDRVDALELAPGDRAETVLAARGGSA